MKQDDFTRGSVPGKPAKVTQRPLTTPVRLRTVEGDLSQLQAMADDVGDDLLRVIVTEPARAGLANDVRDILPNAIDIRIQRDGDGERQSVQRSGRSAHELFSAYLTEKGIADERLQQLFTALYDEVRGGHE